MKRLIGNKINMSKPLVLILGKDDIKNMQNRGTTYAQNNYIGKTE